MTKSELIEVITAKMGHLPPNDVEAMVRSVFKAITGALKSNNRVEIRGFGSFYVKERKPRSGRNPKTGEQIKVPSKRVPFFNVGQELRERINTAREVKPLKKFVSNHSVSEQRSGDVAVG